MWPQLAIRSAPMDHLKFLLQISSPTSSLACTRFYSDYNIILSGAAKWVRQPWC